MYKVE